MKKWSIVLSTSLVATMLYGCGSNSDNATNVHKKAPVAESGLNAPETTEAPNPNAAAPHTGATPNTSTAGAPFSFSEFLLDVDYGANQKYEVEYKNEQTKTESKIEDQRLNKNIEGNDAYAKLEPKFKKLTFDANTSDEEVKKQILSVFDLGKDYKTIDLEVKFADGVDKKYTFAP